MYLHNLAAQPIAFDVPCSGAKAVNSGPLDWTAATTYILDVTQNNQLLDMQNIQSIYVDNLASSGALNILVAGTGQTLQIPAGKHGYLQLLCSDRPIFQFTNTSGNGTSNIWLMNIPVASFIW